MQSNKLVDYVKLYCISGNGGDGIINFRKSYKNSRGGPDGGSGGKGGNIMIKGNKSLKNLNHIKKYKGIVKAQSGFIGKKNLKNGKNGNNTIIDVPIGTIVKNCNNSIKFEIVNSLDCKNLLSGANGGKGNYNFKTSINQSPILAEKGKIGLKKNYILEYRMPINLSIIGLPNTGKSTLLSILSNAKPNISSYPFTTTSPNLGIMYCNCYNNIIIADMPGIISGSANGKGKGLQFLKHIDKCCLLIFLISFDSYNIESDYKILLNEIKQFNKSLLLIPYIVVVNKYDLLTNDDIIKINKIYNNPLYISSKNNTGIKSLKKIICNKIC